MPKSLISLPPVTEFFRIVHTSGEHLWHHSCVSISRRIEGENYLQLPRKQQQQQQATHQQKSKKENLMKIGT